MEALPVTPRQAAYRRELKAIRRLNDPATPPAEREKAWKIVREAALVRDEKRRERQAQQRANYASRGGRSGELAAIEAFITGRRQGGTTSPAPDGDGRTATSVTAMSAEGSRGSDRTKAGQVRS